MILHTESHAMKVIAHIENDFDTKFGVPRQSGLLDSLKARIIFEPEYRVPEAFRGMEEYSHLWLIWQFSKAVRESWSPTVRPPRLGGNKRMGVFATRSPYRPNAIGLSSVRLDKLETDSRLGPVLYVSGADLMNGTPIYDIKPYLAYADSHPEAKGGFTDQLEAHKLQVEFPAALLEKLPKEKRQALIDTLAADPRPRYQHDPGRIYGMSFNGYDVRFQVVNDTLVVLEII